MDRYISAEALKQIISEEGTLKPNYYSTEEIKADIIDMIDEVPAADVRPIVHGKWISLTDCVNAGVYCSVCNKKIWKEDYALCNRKNKIRSDFCPNCGAVM